MKSFIVAAALAIAAPAIAQPYVAAGTAGHRQEAGGMIQTRAVLSAIAGYRAGPIAAEAFYGGSADSGVAALAHAPIGRGFSLFARVAAHRMTGEITESFCVGGGGSPGPTSSLACPGGGTPANHTVSWSGWAPGIGAGVAFAPGGDGLGVRAGFEQTGSIGPLERARILSLAVTYSF